MGSAQDKPATGLANGLLENVRADSGYAPKMAAGPLRPPRSSPVVTSQHNAEIAKKVDPAAVPEKK